ncbi:hypothetical protein AB1Y20_020267 [Prymnesium parvum]|uniref:Uncharacterized protein n=1 Tax=Prymnesium parvum TaxID=97485 RepID=A0AB34JSZ6_PRYPA
MESLPASLQALLPQAPVETAEACVREWEELLALQSRLLAESERGLPHAPLAPSPLVQHVTALLDAEDVRWRDGAYVLERRWAAEREALVGWWRSDDAAALHQSVEDAGEMAARLTASLRDLPPSASSAERVALREALGLAELDISTLLLMSEQELGAPIKGDTASSLCEHVFRAAACREVPLARDFVATVERLSRERARAVSGDADPPATPFGATPDVSMPPDSRARAAAMCLLLSLVANATPLQRLHAMLPYVYESAIDEEPLPFRAQLDLFRSMHAAAATAKVAMVELLRSFSTTRTGSDLAGPLNMQAKIRTQDAEDALNAVLSKRPYTWAVQPPHALEFLMWCSTVDDTIRAAVSSTVQEP